MFANDLDLTHHVPIYFLGHLAEQRNVILMWIATERIHKAHRIENMKKKNLTGLEGREWVNELR